MEGSSTAALRRDEPRVASPRRWLPIAAIAVLLAAALILPQLTANQFYIHLANLMLLNSIFAVSLGLIASVGQISLGHAAFVAAGGYISAIAALSFKIPPVFGIILAGLCHGACGSGARQDPASVARRLFRAGHVPGRSGFHTDRARTGRASPTGQTGCSGYPRSRSSAFRWRRVCVSTTSRSQSSFWS